MRLITAIAVVAAMLINTPVRSAPAEMTARALVENGIKAYKQGSAADAIRVWIKGSALEGNQQALTQANSLRQIEDFYGKPVSMDVVKEYEAGPKVRVLYLTINYQKGAAFAKFQAYQVPNGQWVTTQFFFHTDAAQIFPQCMFPS
jgi:hypothetical protein